MVGRCSAESATLHSREKTEHHKNGGVRYCPVFPELLPYLEDLVPLARKRNAEPTDYVIANNRGSDACCRTTFTRILEKSGIEPWPKLFQNMRASRGTELLAKYPVQDVCSWIGNSQVVAMRHYAMVMDSVFTTAAAGLEPVSGGSIQVKNTARTPEPRGSTLDAHELSVGGLDKEKPLVLLGFGSENQQDQGYTKWAIQDSNL